MRKERKKGKRVRERRKRQKREDDMKKRMGKKEEGWKKWTEGAKKKALGKEKMKV